MYIPLCVKTTKGTIRLCRIVGDGSVASHEHSSISGWGKPPRRKYGFTTLSGCYSKTVVAIDQQWFARSCVRNAPRFCQKCIANNVETLPVWRLDRQQVSKLQQTKREKVLEARLVVKLASVESSDPIDFRHVVSSAEEKAPSTSGVTTTVFVTSPSWT